MPDGVMTPILPAGETRIVLTWGEFPSDLDSHLTGPAPDIAGVAGVSGLVLSDGRLTCQLAGDMQEFLRAIAGAPIADLTIEPAHLEEAFLELYRDAEEVPA